MLTKKKRLILLSFWGAILIFTSHCSTTRPLPTPAAPRLNSALWIDTDISAAEKNRDLDDAIALIQAFHSPEITLKGVSTVFGNIPLDRVTPIAQSVVERFGPVGLKVYAGASNADALGQETPASRAMTESLKKEPLTLVALGPLTNIATVIKNHPELKANIIQVIAMGGRRPLARFTTGTTNTRAHRDFNFEMDPAAFQALFNANVPVVLIPFELSSQIWLNEEDLKLLQKGGAAAQWLAPHALEWLKLWKKLFSVDGLNPFESAAMGYAIRAEGIDCETQPVQIQSLPNDEETTPKASGNYKPYLLASPDLETPDHALYCTKMRSGFKKELLDRLATP